MKNTSITKWFKPNFDVGDTNSDHTKGTPAKTKTPKKNYFQSKKALLDLKDSSNLNLIEKLAPIEVTDLAVHNKKVCEVESWLLQNVVNSDKVKILLLTGPTGSGKTATIRVLTKQFNIKIIEWINPADADIEEFRGPGQTTKFTDFLIQSSRYPSLLMNNSKKQVILVEDFPNSIIHNPSEFEAILELLNNNGKYSAIFICAETKDNNSNLAHKLFPDNIQIKYGVDNISFNMVSNTLLKQCLKRACSLVQQKSSDLYQIPNQQNIDTIINSSMGDIRSALNYFNFACLKGSQNLPSVINISLTSGSKRKRKEKDKETLTNMCRDESLGLLHGVGRTLYPKRRNITESKWKFEHSPESIVDQFITIPSLFVTFLHENYLRYFGDLTDVISASEILSTSELFLNNWKDDNIMKTYGLWITIMGLMVHNKNAISKWNPVQGPKHLKYKFKEEFHGSVKINPVDVGYYNLIYPIGYTTVNKNRFNC